MGSNEKNGYIGILSRTDGKFWSEDAESGEILCKSRYVHKRTMFKIIEDIYSGNMLIQSYRNRKYVEVRQDNSLIASATIPTTSTQFQIDRVKGLVKSVYNKMYINMRNGKVFADSSIPVPLDIYAIKIVAIADFELKVYAIPGFLNGKNAILFNSPTPYDFFQIDTATSISFLQTQSNEFLQAISTTEPVCYTAGLLDRSNFRLNIDSLKNEKNLFTIKADSSSINKFFKVEELSGDNNSSVPVLFSNADKPSVAAAKFNIILTI